MNKKLHMFKVRNLKNYGETSTTLKIAKRFFVPFITYCPKKKKAKKKG